MPTGFSNEKSAEYVVLNNLYNKVSDKCSFFYPFIFQSKRDDTLLSLQNETDNLHLIICFARRPKTDYIDDDKVIITFRETLFRRANYFKRRGISSIIGAPIGTCIDEIGFGAHCQWFYPEPNYNNDFSQVFVYKEDRVDLVNANSGVNVINKRYYKCII